MKYGKWKYSNGSVADLDAGTVTYEGETWPIIEDSLNRAREYVAAGKLEGNVAWERVLEPNEYVPTVARDHDRLFTVADETHDAIPDLDAELRHRRRMDYLLTGDVTCRDERAVVLPDPLRDDPEIARADRERRWALKARRD